MDSVQNSNKTKNYLIGFGATALVSGGLGYAYNKTSIDPIIHGLLETKNSITDNFREKIKWHLLDAPKEDLFQKSTLSEKMMKEVGSLNNSTQLKEFVQRNTKNLQAYSENDIKIVLENIEKMNFEKARTIVERAIFDSDAKYGNKLYYQDLFEKSWDKSAKKFKFDASKMSKVEYDSVMKAVGQIKSSGAINLGLFAALIGGLITLLVVNHKNKS